MKLDLFFCCSRWVELIEKCDVWLFSRYCDITFLLRIFVIDCIEISYDNYDHFWSQNQPTHDQNKELFTDKITSKSYINSNALYKRLLKKVIWAYNLFPISAYCKIHLNYTLLVMPTFFIHHRWHVELRSCRTVAGSAPVARRAVQGNIVCC